MPGSQEKIVRRHEVEELVGLRRSALYAMIARGEFPKPVKLSSRAVGWRLSDIWSWIESRPCADAAGRGDS